ncbi:MAG: alpha/beta hydrolase [Mucispirillum sp.]|nr:alpha/beta hydrolase [Mucispirillum sp.]
MKKFSIIAAVVLLIICTTLYFISNMFYNLALSPDNNKDKVFESSHNAPTKKFDNTKINNDNNKFKEKAEIVSIKSFDGLNLKSYKLAKNNTHKWVIINHGYMQKPYQMGHAGMKFYNQGYNVILPHMRGHGESEGAYIGMGYHDRKDIIKWVEYIISQDSAAEILIYGVSMGGAATMMVSGENLPDNVKCFIEDCGYTSAWDEFSYQLKKIYSLPSFPIMNSVNLLVNLRAGYDLKEASAFNQVQKCKKPMLFIHGDKDTFVPFNMAEKLYTVSSCPEKELFITRNAGHAESFKMYEDIYWQKIFEFAGKYIN